MRNLCYDVYILYLDHINFHILHTIVLPGVTLRKKIKGKKEGVVRE